MYEATNTSNHLYQDGDVIIQPGETVSVDESRANVLRERYSWQFDVKEVEKESSAPSQDEVVAETQDYQNPVLETRDAGYVPQEDLQAESSGGDAQVEANPDATPDKPQEQPSKSSKSRK